MTEQTSRATQAARDAFEAIDQAAYAARREIDIDGSTVVVDGSMYSPSTRACWGAEAFYQACTNDEWQEFEEELDELVSAYADFGYALSWDDGMLWLLGPQFSPEDPS